MTPTKAATASGASAGVTASATTSVDAESSAEGADEDIAKAISVRLVGFAFLPEDFNAGRYSDHVVIDFEYKNESDRPIRALTGVAVFSDLFDREIRSVRLTYDESIGEGAVASDPGRSLELNQFMESDNQLKSKTIDDIVFRFDVEAILWSDGVIDGEVAGAYVAPSGPARRELASLIQVSLEEINFVPENYSAGRYSDHLAFVFEYLNTANQDIRAFTGQAVFLDLFGRELKRIGLTYDSPLSVGVPIVDSDKAFELNQFMSEDQALASTARENLQFEFEMDSVIFADGTRIGQAR